MTRKGQDWEIEAEETPHDNFTQIPNVVLEPDGPYRGLSSSAKMLYTVFRKFAYGGRSECNASTSTLAASCSLTEKTIGKARQELIAAGLVQERRAPNPHGGHERHIITVMDIWPLNRAFYSQPEASGKRTTCKGAILPIASGKRTIEEDLINNSCNQEELGDAIASPPCTPSACFSQAPGWQASNGNDDTASVTRSHPAIQAIKQITGRYPNRQLFRRIANQVGEEPDMERMRDCFERWISVGRNPINFQGWLFEWYCDNGDYYTPGGQSRYEKTKVAIEHRQVADIPADILPLAEAYESASGLSLVPSHLKRDTKALREMLNAGATPDIITGAVSSMRNKGLLVSHPGAVVKIALDAIGTRNKRESEYRQQEEQARANQPEPPTNPTPASERRRPNVRRWSSD